jgi:hypothetical protein
MAAASHSATEVASAELAKIDLSKDNAAFETVFATAKVESSNVLSPSLSPSLPALDFIDDVDMETLESTLVMMRDDTITKPRHICFNTKDKLLCVLDKSDALRPREALRVAQFSVSLLHPSLFGKHAFQLAMGVTGSLVALADVATYKFLCESENEAHQWYSTLRKYTKCCDKCAKVYQYSHETKSNTSLIDDIPVTGTTISLTVVDAKNLKLSNGTKLTNVYGVVYFGDLKYGKITYKEYDSAGPYWDETFEIRYNS